MIITCPDLSRIAKEGKPSIGKPRTWGRSTERNKRESRTRIRLATKYTAEVKKNVGERCGFI